MYQFLGDISKATLSGSETLLALWPSIIAVIVSSYPDCSALAYDNLWWALLFAITSGGSLGRMGTSGAEHHIAVESYVNAKALCERGGCDPWAADQRSRKARRRAMAPPDDIQKWHWPLWGLCLAAWIGFNAFYLVNLQKSFNLTTCDPWFYSIIWYWMSAVPAALQALLSWSNGIELYEPGTAHMELRPCVSTAVRPSLTVGGSLANRSLHEALAAVYSPRIVNASVKL